MKTAKPARKSENSHGRTGRSGTELSQRLKRRKVLPKFLHIDLENRLCYTTEVAPTPADLRFVETGLHAIIRLSDLTSRHAISGWEKIPPGVLAAAEEGKSKPKFHVHPTWA